MAAAIAITPASGSIIAVVTACRVNVTGADDNDAATYDTDNTPVEDPIPFRLIATKAGIDDLVSHEFTVSAGGAHVWDNIIFPDDGSWTVDLVDQRNDSVAATLAVTVSA